MPVFSNHFLLWQQCQNLTKSNKYNESKIKIKMNKIKKKDINICLMLWLETKTIERSEYFSSNVIK